MGFFSHVASYAKSAISKFGGVLETVGSYAAPVLKKIGSFAPIVGTAVGLGLNAAGVGFGNPALVAAGEAVRRGGNAIGDWVNKGADVADRVTAFGTHISSVVDNGVG